MTEGTLGDSGDGAGRPREGEGGCMTGSFAAEPIRRLAALLAEPDKALRRRQLVEATARGAAAGGLELAAGDAEAFAATLERSCEKCQRASLLWKRNELAISFNGGKDACVVLYLWLAAVAAAAIAEGADVGAALAGQTVIFFDSAQEFPAVRSFVSIAVESLGLRMFSIENCSFQRGMQDLVASGLRAVVMGQRRGDPWMENVDAFSPSTPGWPAFMRINPIIDWSFTHVWMLLRSFGLPYCSLYDDGYTSLGSIQDTGRNPELRQPDGSYAPAYRLKDSSTERSGRLSKGQPAASPQKAGEPRSDSDEERREASRPEVKPSPSLRAFKSACGEPAPRTAGLVVIGNELLSGKVRDSNAHYICQRLHARGVVVKSIETIPDDVDVIARVVGRMSDRCSFVFTCGGLGPTHDDVTMMGVAEAFKEYLVEDVRFYEMLASGVGRRGARGDLGSRSRQGSAAGEELEAASGADGRADLGRGGSRPSTAPAPRAAPEALEAANRKLAQVPRTSRVEWLDDGNPWPLVSMRNVYMLAGMPSVCMTMFQRAAKDGRFDHARRWVSASLWLDAEEEEVLDAIQGAVEEFPFVEIGSYPAAGAAGRRRLNVTIESFDAEAVAAARSRLLAALPPGLAVEEEPAAADEGSR